MTSDLRKMFEDAARAAGMKSEDKELLELAAKAAGVKGYWTADGDALFLDHRDPDNNREWNPLNNDGPTTEK